MIKYKGYSIYQDMTGIAQYQYYFAEKDYNAILGFGDSVEDCEKQIHKLVNDKIINILLDLLDNKTSISVARLDLFMLIN